ncbi:RCC1-like G exchanging factor-like protein [Ditylenchus destructor]|uniref:RCC1-like G exchanging factor-like protein n=1 Tax=Ditylenchus destructor TaxID=166010 RepID=A0AAD4R535_9BILA|nr:RCC1-like G exchanging factor-like protein [Ditylenchus destructor]
MSSRRCLVSAILNRTLDESSIQRIRNNFMRFHWAECQAGRCASTTVIPLPPGQMPTEDVPPEQEKHVHDFRTRRVQGGIFGSGICSTGSFGLPSLVEKITSPDQIYKPRKLGWLDAKKIRRVAAGFGFSLFASHKELYGAGLNNFYQIGGPMRTNRKHGRLDQEAKQWYIRGRRITLPEGAGSIHNIAAGRLHAIVATENMYLALGDNSHGQCGLDPEKVGVSACDLEYNWPRITPTWDCKERENQVRQVHCCLDTSFILLRSGAIYAFGLGTDGQLGNGNLNFQWEPRLVEGDLKGVKISKITGNTDTLMAVSTEGDLFMWGQNEYGQLSMISDEPQVYFPRHVPLKLGKLVDVAATGSSCLVLNSEGEVYTWGFQILGLGPKIEYLSNPMQLDPPLFACAVGDEGRIKKIYGGNTMFGAVNEGGHIFTWGPNTNGNLGVGHPNHQFFPYQVFLPETIADKNEAVSFGPDHSVFLLYYGNVQVTLRRNSMPPKKCKPPTPMVTRSRAKAKNSTEPQPPVLAKRSRKDTSPMPEQVHSEDDVLNAGCASRNGSLENIQKENCKPSHVNIGINIGIPKNIGILNVELNELYQENETIAELERFDGQETFSINNAIELLNTNYDNWKSHFTGTSSDDDSIKAFISYENLHYPDNLADLANKCGVDVVTLTNAFENGLDITHENITHVSNSSEENSVHSDQTSLKKKPGRPSNKRGKASIGRQRKEKNQAKKRNQNYRDNETPEQRNKRLSQDNSRIISRRSNETQEERNKRLSQQKNIDISRRSNETQDERNKRLSQDNSRIISRRSNETQDERNKRLSQQLERQNELINNRTQAENIRKESDTLAGTLTNVNDITPFSLGSFDYKCKDCGALHFEMEASLNELRKPKQNRTYDMCCSLGKIAYEKNPEYPPVLKSLFLKKHPKHREFYDHIRNVNSSFGFVSINAHVKRLSGQYHYRIQGPLYHLFNQNAHPIEGETHTYGQLFFLDTQEASNLRANNPVNKGIDESLFLEIENELRLTNPLIKSYHMMYEIEKKQNEEALRRNEEPKRVTLSSFRPLNTSQSIFNALHFAGKLMHQWAVDMWTRIEGDLLEFQKLKNISYQSATASNLNGDLNPDRTDEISRKTILYSDYPGSIKYYQEEFRKSMIMAKRFGPPDLFITITFGSDNEDLKNAINVQLPDGDRLQQQTNFRPDMVARAFELIYDDFINLIWKNNDNGKPTFGKRRSHAIIDLKLHLENEQNIYWNKKKDTAQKIKQKKEQDTQLTAFFKLCRESEHSDFAKKFRYWEIVEHFTWHEQQKIWEPTKIGKSENLGRMKCVLSSTSARKVQVSRGLFIGLAVGIAWTSLLRKFASPDFAAYSPSDDANARGTFPGSFTSVNHRHFKLLFHGSSTLCSDGSILLCPQSSAL